MVQKMKLRKALRVPLIKIQNACVKSTCCAVTNLELTYSRFLSMNSYTSIAGAITLRILSKQKNFPQTTSSQIMPPEDFFKYTEMSIAQRGRRYFILCLPVSILLESWHFHVGVTSISIQLGTTRHIFFLSVGSVFKVNKHCCAMERKRVMNTYIIFFLRNRGSEKERVSRRRHAH